MPFFIIESSASHRNLGPATFDKTRDRPYSLNDFVEAPIIDLEDSPIFTTDYNPRPSAYIPIEKFALYNETEIISRITYEPGLCIMEVTSDKIHIHKSRYYSPPLYLASEVNILAIYPLNELSTYDFLIQLGTCEDESDYESNMCAIYQIAGSSCEIEIVKHVLQLNPCSSCISAYGLSIGCDMEISRLIFNHMAETSFETFEEVTNYLIERKSIGCLDCKVFFKNDLGVDTYLSIINLAIDSGYDSSASFFLTRMVELGHLAYIENILEHKCGSAVLNFLFRDCWKNTCSDSESSMRKIRFLVENESIRPKLDLNKALILAIESGALKIARYLIESGAPLPFNIMDYAIVSGNMKGSNRECDHGDVDFVQYLINLGPDLVDVNGVVKGLGDKGAKEDDDDSEEEGDDNSDCDSSYNPNDNSYITFPSNVKIIDILLENGLDVNRQNRRILKAILEKGCKETVYCLMRHGVQMLDISLVKRVMNQRLTLESESMTKLLIDSGASYLDPDLFLDAVTRGFTSIVKIMIENGINIHVADEMALKIAASYGYLEIVKVLVENGADVREESDRAIRIAARANDIPMVEYLISKGADVSAEDSYCMRIAKINSYDKLIKIFEGI